MVTSFLFCSLTKSMCLCVCLNRRFSILPLWLSLLVYNAVKQFVLYLIYIYLCVCAYMQKSSSVLMSPVFLSVLGTLMRSDQLSVTSQVNWWVVCMISKTQAYLWQMDSLAFSPSAVWLRILEQIRKKQTNYILYNKADVTEHGLKAKGKKAMNGNRKICGKFIY